MSGRPEREMVLECEVEVVRGNTRINADKATIRQVENEIEATGNVRIQRLGDRYTGDTLKLNLDTGAGSITHPTYRIERNNGQGKAERVDFESEDLAHVIEGTYSTCEGPDPDWYLKSESLTIDMDRDVGAASRTIVFFKGVPILGVPAMSFPLSGNRKSGVLTPLPEFGPKGLESLAIPYYFNIAPNRDLTLYPKFINQRGLQIGANGRYLESAFSGETTIEALFDDKLTGTNRYKITSNHSQILTPGLTAAWNLNKASDDEYPRDFAKSITASSQRQLVRELRTDYGAAYWSLSARMQSYQVLQDSASILDPTLRVDRPYDRVPQLILHTGRYDVEGFDWAMDSELTRFSHPEKVRGSRLVINPQISYPLIRPGYFITPRLSLHATVYDLENPASGAAGFSRVLPTFSIDSGLIFERQARFLGNTMTQTLEPRLFYVNTPYRDQSLFPNFDSAEAGFNFAQIFSENRFIGADRINDANQLTAALVSRYIEPNGSERLRLTFGQRFYFREQRVVLDATAAVRNETRSDLLLAASGHVAPGWSIESGMQYSESVHRFYNVNVGAQWQPQPRRVLNAEYRYLRDNFEQINISGQWPLSQRLYSLGRVSYSLQDRKTVDSLIGMEYNADCWAFRLVAQRFITAEKKSTTSILVQLELNGLSKLNFGANPLEVLSRNIPGFQMPK